MYTNKKGVVFMYRKISRNDLKNVRDNMYMCQFQDEFLETIGVQYRNYEIGYLWYSDSEYEEKGYEFYVIVRDRSTCITESGFIQGKPRDEIIKEKIERFISEIEIIKADENEVNRGRKRRLTDKRGICFLR